MARIDHLIFGYRKVKISPENLSSATSLLLYAKISSRINSDGTVSVRERDMERLRKLFSGQVEYSESELLGIYGRYKKLRNKGVMFSALACALILTLISSLFVWDVRIDGNSTLTDAVISAELEDCGFSVGSMWYFTDKSVIENRLLTKCPALSWVNINRRGTVAYVRVSEKLEGSTQSDIVDSGYRNIVAACDCVIEEVSVKRGVAVVKKGDTVKAGDLLISGVTPDGFCSADGTVLARVTDTVSASAEREYTLKSDKSEELISRDLKIFNFSINIFKRYRKTDNECDIIEDVKVFSLFGKCNLPIKIVSRYAVDYEERECSYNDAQLVRLVSARLTAATVKRLIGADLTKIKTDGKFTDWGYLMSSHIEYVGDIGIPLPFDAK